MRIQVVTAAKLLKPGSKAALRNKKLFPFYAPTGIPKKKAKASDGVTTAAAKVTSVTHPLAKVTPSQARIYAKRLLTAIIGKAMVHDPKSGDKLPMTVMQVERREMKLLYSLAVKKGDKQMVKDVAQAMAYLAIYNPVFFL